MYFMPKVNLFKNTENPEEAIDIADKIEKLSNNFGLVIKGIENIISGFASLCNILSNFHKIMVKHLEERNALPDEEIFQSLEKARIYLQFLNPQN